jgi:hypothetical protein
VPPVQQQHKLLDEDDDDTSGAPVALPASSMPAAGAAVRGAVGEGLLRVPGCAVEEDHGPGRQPQRPVRPYRAVG